MFVSRNLSLFKTVLTLLLLSCFISVTAEASVTIQGSRIIYPANAKSVDVQLKNNDNLPYVMQTWFDDGDIDSRPEQTTQTPFIVTPPVFRIQPKSGQIVRVIFSGNQSLPQDRESVFWFNVLQIPPVNRAGATQQNAMMVMLRNRIKIFYRPAAVGKPGNILDGLRIRHIRDSKKGNGLEIDNPQPWHASLVTVSLKIAGQTFQARPDMVAPFSKQLFWFPASGKHLQGAGVASLAAINDQGARISENYTVEVQ
ncbi:fimbria/pilus periplasmic chaperone [Pantoea sp.]|uniref:fimbria/pilus periplasmic chaperone n=1 Tax=Pantoea sp. TaxID=69393 RepID=UPI0028AE457C|nr:fimbria/pilus periplasmic chaperone [Pantoea sp.]